ncbi:3-octaprenyl-4-hydroxybenzoate carboxy-lyase [Campylobacter concisus]|uniref:3-octaprenyl-4-hydroxybenzoate carboxy-lyase n=1 Tax=Campylobacter concisus TaxID=199 RepID=UPI000CD9672A|nr:3-octaprenyl-4-hydroxybenzoate carboxy-lyase [Campylobacter concisus]
MCQCEILLLLKLLTKFRVKFTVLSDEELLAKFQSVALNIKELRQIKKQSKTPICVLKFGV